MARSRPTLWRTQNFLRDPKLVQMLVRRADIRPRDVVYDLGAGTGIITEALSRRGARVIAIEGDPRLYAALRRRFARRPNVRVRRADILEHPLPRAEHVIFASLPFDITSAVLQRLTTSPRPPRDAYLAVQREAAERFRGEPRQTLAALLIAPWFESNVVHRFARADFAPSPSVDVVLLRLRKRGPPLIPPARQRLYRDFTAAAFTTRRPDVGAALVELLGAQIARRVLTAGRIDATAALSTIGRAAWLRLFDRFAQLPQSVTGLVAGAESRLRRQQRRLRKVHRTRAPRDRLRWAPAMIHA
jgi:23S rRNA (adenine-N6)-dimethyltransferase